MNFLDRLSGKKRLLRLKTGENDLLNKIKTSSEAQTFISYHPDQRVESQKKPSKGLERKKLIFSESTFHKASLNKVLKSRDNGISLKSLTPVTFFPDFNSAKFDVLSRKSLIQIRRSVNFSKFLNYSPSRINMPKKSKP